MLRSIVGFDWQKSRAHCLLLSKFINPQNPDDFSKSDIWESVHGEKPNKAIIRFSDEGLIVVSELEGVLSYRYKASELKNILKEHKLPVSGRKEDMIKRLVTADPAGMKNTVTGLQVYQCSKQGSELVERYLQEEKRKRDSVEAQVIEYIRNRKFKEASLSVAAYEAEQVFPRGIGIDWKHHNPNHDIEKLSNIFSGKPKLLSKLDDEQSEILRQAAAMMSLWGKNTAKEWLPPNFKTELSFDVDTTARMFLFHASYKTSLEQYRNSGVVKSVEISTAPDSCNECKRFNKKRYKLNEVPELPHENCCHEKGCRCVLIPVVM